MTADASPTGAAASVGTTSKGLSGGAIGAIVAVSLVAGALIIVFLVRKIFLRKRENRRNTFVWPQPDFTSEHDRSNDISEKMYLRTDGLPPPLPEKPMTPTAHTPVLAPPPMSYNSPVAPPVMSPAAAMSPGGGAVSLAPAGIIYAYVRCTYIPTLPDELSITVGEMVQLVSEFDDGWAVCVNAHNERGVVPLECLDRGNAPPRQPGQYLGQGTGDWRMSRRASSLHGAQAVRY